MVKYYTAIIITPLPGIDNFKAAKYRNIHNQPEKLERFFRFAVKNFPGATHINFYDKQTRKFIEQVRIETQPVNQVGQF